MTTPRTLIRVLVLFLPFVLTACGAFRVAYEPPNPAAVECSPDTGNPRTVRVCAGDTLIKLAHSRNVTVRGLMRANNLPDEKILVGQILTIPAETVHVVQPGDQVLGIARLYGVSQDSIIAANELKRPYTIFPDQRLAVPTRGGVRVAEQTPAYTRNLPDSPPVTNDAPTAPIIVNAPQPANEPEDMSTSTAPSDATPVVRTPAVETPADASGGSSSAGAAAAGTAVAVAPIPPSRPASAGTATPRPVVVAKPATTAQPAGEPRFLLPVQGRIVSEFGPKSGGLHNDGINIAAPRGTPILSTEAGTIAYAGDGLPGFGNLILIRHADGWTSAYAHADSMDVKRGDKVTRGQTIGRVGQTGSVTEPQLHFELRKHDRAVDPKPLLGT